MKKFFAPFCLILTLGILPHHDFEKQLQRAVKEHFPSAKDIRVSISTSPFFEMAFGKIDGVDISVTNGDLLGLRISELKIYLHNLHFSPLKLLVKRKVRISSFKEAHARFVILQEDMEKFIRKRASERIKNLQFTFKKNGFVLSGNFEVAKDFLEPSFSLEGHAVVTGGDKIFLEIPRAKLSVVPLPEFLMDFFMEDVNPVFDLREAEKQLSIFKELNTFLGKPMQTSLKSVTLEEGKAIMETYGTPQK